MPDDPRIRRAVEEAVGGSGLPQDRRQQVAEELHSHLEQSVASRRAAGMSEDAAVESALAAFGPSSRVRRQLRGRQWRLDAGQAVRRALRLAWVPAFYGGAFALLPAAAAAATGAQSFHPAQVAALSSFQFFAVMAFMFGAEICNLKLERGVSIEQHRFVPRLAHWMLTLAGGYVLVLLLGMLTFAGCGPSILAVGNGRPAPPFAGLSAWQVLRNLGPCWLHPPIGGLSVCVLVLIGGAIGLTCRERRRCVNE